MRTWYNFKQTDTDPAVLSIFDDIGAFGVSAKSFLNDLASAQGDASGRTWVEFAVTDWGVGISGEVAQQLYTPFFTTKDEGMGLGLSLCRTVVEQHGSHLTYRANTPQGTVFSFTMPTWRND